MKIRKNILDRKKYTILSSRKGLKTSNWWTKKGRKRVWKTTIHVSTQLGGAVDMVDRRDVIQRNFDRLEWPHTNSWSSTRLSIRSCTWVGAIICISTHCGMKGLTAALKRRTCGYRSTKNWMWASNMRLQARKPIVSRAAWEAVWPAGWGRWFSPSVPL